MLAEMKIKLEASALLTRRAAWQVDRGNPVPVREVRRNKTPPVRMRATAVNQQQPRRIAPG